MEHCNKHRTLIPKGFQCGACIIDAFNSRGAQPLSPEQQRIHELTATIEQLDTQVLELKQELRDLRAYHNCNDGAGGPNTCGKCCACTTARVEAILLEFDSAVVAFTEIIEGPEGPLTIGCVMSRACLGEAAKQLRAALN